MFQQHSEAIRLVVLWSCAIVFVATSFLAVLALIFPKVISNQNIREWLHKGLVVEIVVISVGYFSHNLGENAGAQVGIQQGREAVLEAAKKSMPGILDLLTDVPAEVVSPILETSYSIQEMEERIRERTWTVEASVDPFSDGPADSESRFEVNLQISDRADNPVGELRLAPSQTSQIKTIFTSEPYLTAVITAASGAGPGPGDERATISSTLHLKVSRDNRLIAEKDIPLNISTIPHLGAPDRADSRAMSLGTEIREEFLDTEP